jgi:hypothetical protein
VIDSSPFFGVGFLAIMPTKEKHKTGRISMGHENENRMMFDNFPKHVEEQDPDEAYDELRQEELDQSWYDLKEIAAEQRREELREELQDIAGVFKPGWITKNQAE